MDPQLRAESKHQSLEWKQLTSLVKKVQNSVVSRKSDIYSFFGIHKAQFWNSIKRGYNSKQCPLQWDAAWQVETSNLNQMPRTTFERCCTVAWICLSLHCHPHFWNPPPIEIRGIVKSSVPSWPGPFGLPLVWSTQRCFKRLPLCQLPRSEGSGACMTCHTTKNIFSEGMQKLLSHRTKCIEKEGDCVEKWCSCKHHIAVVLILKSTLCIIFYLLLCVRCMKVISKSKM
jgi:hypothetical protein